MNEQSANNVGNYLSKKVGNKKKVVVVHPDEVARPEDGLHALGVLLVRLDVRLPVHLFLGCGLVGDVLPEQVVEQRPERCGGSTRQR